MFRAEAQLFTKGGGIPQRDIIRHILGKIIEIVRLQHYLYQFLLYKQLLHGFPVSCQTRLREPALIIHILEFFQTLLYAFTGEGHGSILKGIGISI